jgi:hypothetical protein
VLGAMNFNLDRATEAEALQEFFDFGWQTNTHIGEHLRKHLLILVLLFVLTYHLTLC